jgi:hypothetical protein
LQNQVKRGLVVLRSLASEQTDGAF